MILLKAFVTKVGIFNLEIVALQHVMFFYAHKQSQ